MNFEIVVGKNEVELKYAIDDFKKDLKVANGRIVAINPVLGPDGCVAVIKYKAKISISKPLKNSLDKIREVIERVKDIPFRQKLIHLQHNIEKTLNKKKEHENIQKEDQADSLLGNIE